VLPFLVLETTTTVETTKGRFTKRLCSFGKTDEFRGITSSSIPSTFLLLLATMASGQISDSIERKGSLGLLPFGGFPNMRLYEFLSYTVLRLHCL
jgi:hypothetical protein